MKSRSCAPVDDVAITAGGQAQAETETGRYHVRTVAPAGQARAAETADV